MTREFFSIGKDETGKYVHYHGCVWESETGCQLDTVNWCYAQIEDVLAHGDPLVYMGELASECEHYVNDIDQDGYEDLLNSFYAAHDGDPVTMERLHLSDISPDTPCGDYFFDDSDEPTFAYISAKAYAERVEDVICSFVQECIGGIANILQAQQFGTFDPEEFDCAALDLSKEHVIPLLERLGLSVRPDGSDF